MEKEELKILEELRRILNSKNEAIVILNNYFKGGVGKSKLSTMFAYLTDKFKPFNFAIPFNYSQIHTPQGLHPTVPPDFGTAEIHN